MPECEERECNMPLAVFECVFASDKMLTDWSNKHDIGVSRCRTDNFAMTQSAELRKNLLHICLFIVTDITNQMGTK